ncbi:MAG: ABC transporter permease [Eggerthellaceae bacterium]|nr:ABC transporter permease [Eggerthellaceae bacterium]
MRISDLLYETWSALMSNKGRTLLTILGIVIGISAVIAMTSLIDGVKNSLVSQLGLDQSRVVYIYYWNGSETSAEDLTTIEEGVDGYEFITGMQSGYGKASTGVKQADTSIMGVSKGFFSALGLNLVEGRMLSDKELNSDAMLVVIDSALARSLFGEDTNPVGEQIEIGNDQYSIIGVVEASSMFTSQGTAYMPWQTCSIRITGSTSFDTIVGYANEGEDMESLVARTESFIRQRFQITDEDQEGGFGYVYVQSIASIQEELSAMLMSFQLMMTAVASISLLVGGIGIMNMMLTNVTERIREIGLRKALGAHRSDITAQFLTESVAICLVGGLIGFLLGYGAAWVLALASSGAMGDLLLGESMTITPAISPSTVLLAIGICAGIGIVFGFWPAYRAAKLDPVESLRYQ